MYVNFFLLPELQIVTNSKRVFSRIRNKIQICAKNLRELAKYKPNLLIYLRFIYFVSLIRGI